MEVSTWQDQLIRLKSEGDEKGEEDLSAFGALLGHGRWAFGVVFGCNTLQTNNVRNDRLFHPNKQII
jgi:hypothetical protein